MENRKTRALGQPVAEVRRLSDFVELAREGDIRMPRFQRGFRWDHRDVDDLFDSVRRGFPIGSLLLWKKAAPAESVDFGSFTVGADERNGALWVVDGQQRLTSLVATLTKHGDVAPQFELYFDLVNERFVRRGQRRVPPIEWLPLNLILDTSDLLDDLIRRRDDGIDEQALSRARELASTISEYRVPISIVETDDEAVLREIFHRMNSGGHRITAAEVFRALHAAFEPGSAGDLKTLLDTVNSKGFGSLRDDTVLRCVLAVRGGDVYREFQREFKNGEDPAEAFELTARAMERVFAFLRDDASIPHARALPYNGVLPILTRFFSLHPDPEPRNRNLLRRWVWRGSMAWGRDVSALRQAVQDVDSDELGSVQRLLRGVEASEPSSVDLDAVQLNKAATKMNIALLSSLAPRDLRDGDLVDVGALLEEEGPNALLAFVEPASPQLAGRLLHPDTDPSELPSLLREASPEARRSHAIPDEAVDALVRGEPEGFLRMRAAHLQDRLDEERRRLAEPDADDRGPLQSLVITDP
jgi:hypothetical protein